MEINKEFLGCFGKLPKRKRTELIVIHHTCTSTPARTRAALKKEGCSTHFEVDRDGTIYQYADLDRRCSHCGSLNCASVGIDITHAKDDGWTDAQIKSAKELFEYLSKKLNIPLEYYEKVTPGFYFHRAIGDTVCPQDFPAAKAGLEKR